MTEKKTLKKELKVGYKIDVGKFRNVRTNITKITLDNHGQPVIHTSKGEKKALTFRLVKLDADKEQDETVSDKQPEPANN